MEHSDEWELLLIRQDNVFARSQAIGYGYTDEQIEADVVARRVVPLLRGVYAAVTGEPTPRMRQRAALLFIRGPALLSHATAATLLGLRGGDTSGPVHVTVPYGSSARGCAGVVVHRSKAFAHIGLDSDPPVTTKIVTLIDLAVEAPTPRAGMRFLTAGAAAARLDGAKILESLDLRRPRRYVKALRAAAEFLLEGVDSTLELEYATDVEAAHGLPTGIRQVRHRVGDTNRYEDVEYRMRLGVLTVRLDGFIVHANRRTARSDRARDNAAELEGRARLTFGYDEVHHDPCDTARLVFVRLVQLGWDGEFVSCARCTGR